LSRTKHGIGLGFSFFLSDSHYFHFKENMGSGTNNIGELMALFYMLKFSLGRGMRSFQVFGDSLMVINWMCEQVHIQNIGLLVVAKQLKEIARDFQDIRFTHICREKNQVVDKLSKKAWS
jgi:ribonuclease HI